MLVAAAANLEMVIFPRLEAGVYGSQAGFAGQRTSNFPVNDECPVRA
jgi:hypothetical protein